MKKKLTVLLLAMLLLLSFSAAAMAASIGNNGYPYAMNVVVSASYQLTLTVDAENAGDYQWQVADAEEGPYADIAAAKAAQYTFTPENGKWYRCVVDNEPSKAVQAVKCSS